MSSAAATSFTCTPGKLLNFTAVALNRSPYFSILRGLAFATTHLQPVRPRCQLNRGNLGVTLDPVVRRQRHSSSLPRPEGYVFSQFLPSDGMTDSSSTVPSSRQ